jgi:hypothetical protein
MKTETVVEALKVAAAEIGIVVRTERGSFRGGRCTVDGADVIVLNRLHVPELQLSVLAESLEERDVENVFLKPAVRRALEDAWKRQKTGPEESENAEAGSKPGGDDAGE